MPNPDGSKLRNAQRDGFTLIEILCVIALIGAITSWVVYNQTGLGTYLTRLTPEEVFRRAAAEARYQAVIRSEPVQLSWNVREQRFQFSASDRTIEVDPVLYGEDQLFAAQAFEIWFSPIRPGEGMPPHRAPVLAETDAVPLALVFEPNGVSPPGLVRFRTDQDERSISIDAFSPGAHPQMSAH